MVEIQKKLTAHRTKYGRGLNPTGIVVPPSLMKNYAGAGGYLPSQGKKQFTYVFAELTLPVYTSDELSEGDCLLIFDHEHWWQLCQS